MNPYPPPPPPLTPAELPVPVDLDTSRLLWRVAVALGSVVFALTLIVASGNRQELAVEMLDQLHRSNQPEARNITREQVDSYIWIGFGLMVVLAAGFFLGILWVVRILRRGKIWARAVLTALGVFLVLSALPTVFGLGGESGALPIAVDVLTLVQAVTAGGAIYLMHRPEPTAYFAAHRH